MAIADIRAAVKALLVGTSGVGVVNDLDPFNHDPGDFEGSFKDPTTGRLNGWAIGIREDQPDQWLGSIAHRYEIRIRGLVGLLKDERSLAAADALIEAVVTTFAGTAANRRLTSTVDWTDTPAITRVERRARSSEGSVPAHDITITLFAVKETALA